MKKIIVVKWDQNLGPQPLLQFPPDSDFPEKNFFLKIWAHYEMSESKNESFVRLDEKEAKYLSIVKKENSEIYFIILQLEENEEFLKFQEILLQISETLFKSINTPKLTRIIPEIYNSIKEYSKLNTDQLFFNLFSDKDKLFILNILRKGVIDKISLSKILKEKYGISESSIDLLLYPIFHLGLIIEEDMPGIKNCIFLLNDVFYCRLPSKNLIKRTSKGGINNKPAEKMFNMNIVDFFKNYIPENDNNINKISQLLAKPAIYKALGKIKTKKQERNTFLALISQDLNIYRELKQSKLIIEIENYVYSLSEIHFFMFEPVYLLTQLKNRFLGKEISTSQFSRHVNLIKRKIYDDQ